VPFASKDTFKEAMYETLGSGEELEERLDAAALAILFKVVDAHLEAGVSVTAESNFDAHTDVGPFRRVAERDVDIVQVHIAGDPDALVEKFARRAASGDRHPGHGDDPADAEELREKLAAGLWEPLDLPGRLVRADMDDDEAEVVERVRAALER
jgi:AcrR family transcriptional regulator